MLCSAIAHKNATTLSATGLLLLQPCHDTPAPGSTLRRMISPRTRHSLLDLVAGQTLFTICPEHQACKTLKTCAWADIRCAHLL